ncbi:MAG: tetratricopeptide repeat protein, partial [Bacteroidia bacterium]
MAAIQPVLCREAERDSLLAALKTAKHDTERCAVLVSLIDILPEEDCIKYYDELARIVEANLKICKRGQPAYFRFKKYYANALYIRGNYAEQNGNISKALDFLSKSLAIQEDIGDTEGAAQSVNDLGYIYSKQGDTEA